jgi:hypothetical protein
MTSLTRWISRAAAILACNFASWAAAASACAFASSRSRPARACARSARDYIIKPAKRTSDLTTLEYPKQESQKVDKGPYRQHAPYHARCLFELVQITVVGNDLRLPWGA